LKAIKNECFQLLLKNGERLPEFQAAGPELGYKKELLYVRRTY